MRIDPETSQRQLGVTIILALITLATEPSWAQHPTLRRLPPLPAATGADRSSRLETAFAEPRIAPGLPAVDRGQRFSPHTNTLFLPSSPLGSDAGPHSPQIEFPTEPEFARAQVGPCKGCDSELCEDCLYDKVQSLSKMDAFFQKVDVIGDLRVRQEVDFERNSGPTRNRTRIRVRPGFIYKASDEWEAELRMHTGSIGFGQDTTNPHGDLGQGSGIGFGRHEFNIDRMAIKYTPAWLDGVYFKGGKFGYPMKLNPITAGPMLSQIWDTNVQMEGIVAGQTFQDRLYLDSIRMTGGLAPVLTLNNADESSLLYGQIWAEKELHDHWTAGAGVTYWRWQNLNPDGDLTLSTIYNRGNATIGGLFASQFHIIHPLVTLTYDDNDLYSGLDPIVFAYEVYQNHGAFNSNRDFGFVVGAAYGRAMKTKHKWDWAIWYLWMDIQQDAVFSVVSNGDFQVGTNFRGHTFGVIFFPMEGNARFNAGFYSDEPLDAVAGTEKMQWRFRADVVISF